jgi:hypothetical protein
VCHRNYLAPDGSINRPLPAFASDANLLVALYRSMAVAMLQAEMPFPKSVRLLGVSLSSLQTHGNDEAIPQLDLPI